MDKFNPLPHLNVSPRCCRLKYLDPLAPKPLIISKSVDRFSLDEDSCLSLDPTIPGISGTMCPGKKKKFRQKYN